MNTVTDLLGPPVSRRAQRKLGIERFVPGLGYEKRPCSSCQEQVWLGPNQLKLLAEAPGKTRIICPACMVVLYRADKVALTHLGGRGGGYYHANGHYWGPPEEFQN